MRGPTIVCAKTISQVCLKSGEFITVYFQVDPGKFIQVELRNSSYGLEIFCDSPEVTLKSFESWKED